jgi:hypothetical protein
LSSEPEVPPDVQDRALQSYLQALTHLDVVMERYRRESVGVTALAAWVVTMGKLTESARRLPPDQATAHLAGIVAAACARLANPPQQDPD